MATTTATSADVIRAATSRSLTKVSRHPCEIVSRLTSQVGTISDCAVQIWPRESKRGANSFTRASTDPYNLHYTPNLFNNPHLTSIYLITISEPFHNPLHDTIYTTSSYRIMIRSVVGNHRVFDFQNHRSAEQERAEQVSQPLKTFVLPPKALRGRALLAGAQCIYFGFV